MPNRPTTTTVTDEKPPAPPEDAPVTFTVERLRLVGDQATGYSLSDIAGAFHGVSDSTEITVKDAKTRVRDWLKGEVVDQNAE